MNKLDFEKQIFNLNVKVKTIEDTLDEFREEDKKK
jgi:hypothetical protein